MTDYIPISCDLHDHLEILATFRKPCQIAYRTTHSEVVEILDTIVDIYTKNKEEFVLLDSGKSTRLDMLIKVDGQPYQE
ncbi:hypothetical conserved protein [Candidatus Nitrosoglobus terrae]|uniref:Hypothetical conserved protein n=1 Tax=Candidatus Nitrosoglobus terrae TaxID=1630141 RepID=A0A1Q2SL59_9GAMM|nr:hypothetical protein [Candidatus Nitrosoglobus terrae]BAW79881.1 hypothetical conserved protein [Candidatus Nitrosoglobus terrae]